MQAPPSIPTSPVMTARCRVELGALCVAVMDLDKLRRRTLHERRWRDGAVHIATRNDGADEHDGALRAQRAQSIHGLVLGIKGF